MRNLTSEEISVFWGAIYAAILTLGFCALWPHTFGGARCFGASRSCPALLALGLIGL